MGIHKTTLRVVKTIKAEIDDLIWPVVKWLNSIDGVNTIGSCQGGDGAIRPQPFVTFTAEYISNLDQVINRVAPFSGEARTRGLKFEVHGNTGRSAWFALDFESPEQLDKFCKDLYVQAFLTDEDKP